MTRIEKLMLVALVIILLEEYAYSRWKANNPWSMYSNYEGPIPLTIWEPGNMNNRSHKMYSNAPTYGVFA